MAPSESPPELQPERMWLVPAGSLTLEQFLTAHNYTVEESKAIIEGEKLRSIYSSNSLYQVGDLRDVPHQSIILSYTPQNAIGLQKQLDFRDLLEVNKIGYDEKINYSIAARLARKHAQELVTLADKLEKK